MYFSDARVIVLQDTEIENKRQKACILKQRTHYGSENGSLGFIETLHEQFQIYHNGPMIPKDLKYNLHYCDIRGDVVPPALH